MVTPISVCLTWKKHLIQLSCQSYLKGSSTLVFGADAGELFSSRVKINGSISDSYPITRGVKQGSVLSPILFLMVIDNLSKTEVIKISHHLSDFKQGKKQGKDPLQVSSYRGITISSVLAKILETLILTRMSDVIAELNLPDLLQTAYQKGLSCSDATFATQEALIAHLREGGHPYLCLFDLEKAFDSVELPILLKRLFDIGIRGRCWRIIQQQSKNKWFHIRQLPHHQRCQTRVGPVSDTLSDGH